MKRDLPRILILNGSCLDVVERLQEWIVAQKADIVADNSFRSLSADQLDRVFQGAHAAILPSAVSLSSHHLKKFQTLRTISFASSGYDSIDLDAATRNGVVVTNAPVPELFEAVADMTFGLILAVAREIPQHHLKISAGNYSRGLGTTPWRQTLGIVGLGSIGRAVARRAAGFQMRIIASEPFPDQQFVDKYQIELVDLNDLLRSSDFVSLHVRLNAETHGLIGRRELDLMKSSAFLINTARRDLIVAESLVEAIQNRSIAGAGLDDPPHRSDTPLLNCPNVVFTPHLGNRTVQACDAVFCHAVTSALTVLKGRRPDTVVNPEVYEGTPRARLEDY